MPPRRKRPRLFHEIRDSSERTDPDYIEKQDHKNLEAYRACATKWERADFIRNLTAAERHALEALLENNP